METPTTLNPLGVKGIGEAGTIGATPSVQNAVIDAVAHLGVRHIDMPTTPERVWTAIIAAQPSTGQPSTGQRRGRRAGALGGPGQHGPGPAPRRGHRGGSRRGSGPRDAAALAADGTSPPGDNNASPGYREHLARVLVRRAPWKRPPQAPSR
jgi:hypothetical protein